MRLELQATPEEIREKSGQLLERLGELLSGDVPEFTDALEKALPAKEQELKYPVLRELAAKSRELYAHQVDRMIREIAEVIDEAVDIQKSMEADFLEKGGPYIGPKGGKWADPQHTIHWTGDESEQSRQMAQHSGPPEGVKPLPDEAAKALLISMGDLLYGLQHGLHNIQDDSGFNHYDFSYWHSVRGNLSGMRKMLKKYKGQIDSHLGSKAYYEAGLHLVEKTTGVKVQPQYHATFGSLMLPLDGYFKGDFKQYCSAVKAYGAQFDGNKKCFFIPKLKLAGFDFAAYKADMAKFGIEVADPIGVPAKPSTSGEVAIPHAAPSPSAPKSVEEIISGIHSNHVKDTIVVRLREDGIFEFHSPYAPAFNALFANKGGQLSGITKYNPITHARETFDLDLTEEAIEKLKALFPKWKIVTQGVKEARIKRDQEIAELQKPIPEVQEKLDPAFKLMSYQNEGVRFLDKADGNALIGDEMGLGKAASVDERILTPQGWKRFGDLQVGDEVIDPETGKAARVAGVYPQGMREVWELATKDGETIECDAEHLWHVYTAMDRYRENGGKVLTTAQLLAEGVRTGHGKGQYRWYLPVAVAQEFEFRGALPVPPYVLGVLIGDGAIAHSAVGWTKPDVEIVDRVASLLPEGCAVAPHEVAPDKCPTWGISGIGGKNAILDGLRELGLQGCTSLEKFIPERYLFASIEDRKQLLAGLMDTDGDTPVGATCIYSTSSKRLAEDVIFLARSLGCMASLSTKKAPRYRHNGEVRIGQPSYRVNIRAAFNPYFLERKAEHWEESSLARPVADIRRTDRQVEMQCIAVESVNNTFILHGHVVTHNTIQTLAWAAKNNKKVLVVCPKVVRKNWLEEAHKFFPEHFKGAELVAAQLKKGQVPDLSDVNIATVNYESLSKFEEAIKAAGFDTIVIDESHRAKNPKAQVTQNLQKIGAGMKHHILLSGTAIKNKKEELFTQLDMVAPGKFTKNAIKTASIGGLWLDMHAFYLARAKATVLKDLPEKTTSIVKHPVVGLPDMGDENSVGAISKLKAEIAKGKVPVTKAMVQEILDTSDSHVIVFTDSVEAAKQIQEAFGDEAILHHGQLSDKDRDAAVKEFQKKDEAGNFISKKRVFVTTRQSMAVGATLTAADKVVFNDLPWTAADVRQAEDRAHRIGQKNAVNVYWMTAEGNLFDENVNDILKRKYELGQKLNQGKQLTAAEMEWMSKPITAAELLAQIHGQAAGPKEGASAEGAEEPPAPQVPAAEDMAHPELAPPLPEPQETPSETLPGSAVVIDVPMPELVAAAPVPEKLKEPVPEPVPEKPKEPVKVPVAEPEPVAEPTLLGPGSAPVQVSFETFIGKHGVKIREHKSDPTKVMIKVPKHESVALEKLKDYGVTETPFEGGQYHLIATSKQKVKDLLFAKSFSAFLEWDVPVQLNLFKAAAVGGPFIGPRGGKWADPEHTISWQEGGGQTPVAAGQQPESPKPAAESPPIFWNAEQNIEPYVGATFTPDPTHDADGDGVADAARVGVPAFQVPPLPPIGRLPNLTAAEREMEDKFASTYEQYPEEMADAFYQEAAKNNYVFETDAAKALMPEWSRPDLPPDQKGQPINPERAQTRALFNTAMHQTANAIAKRAFIKRLDEIAKMPPEKRTILVTSGGVAGGKGSALAAKPELAQSVSATWDAAGEQNATENPWLLAECEKRGIKPVFLFVAADPAKTWPGAVERAKGIGRMVDARVFADSYAHGAKNFAAFHEKNKDRATFIFAKAAKGQPAQFLDKMPPEALSTSADQVYEDAMQYVEKNKASLPPHIVTGATAGQRIWGAAGGASA